MTNTALGAGAEKAQEIIFISEAHEEILLRKIKRSKVSGCVPQGTLLLPWH